MQFIHRHPAHAAASSKQGPLRAGIAKTGLRPATGRGRRPECLGATRHPAPAPLGSADQAAAALAADDEACDWEQWLFEGGDLLMGLPGEAAAL